MIGSVSIKPSEKRKCFRESDRECDRLSVLNNPSVSDEKRK